MGNESSRIVTDTNNYKENNIYSKEFYNSGFMYIKFSSL